MAENFTVQGIPELNRAITRLGNSVIGRKVTNLHRKIGRMVRDNIRAELSPDVSGNQRRSIEVKTKKGRVFVWSNRKISPHLHLNEFGTAERFHKKTGKSVGRVKPNPGFARGRNKSRGKALAMFVPGYRKFMLDAVKAK